MTPIPTETILAITQRALREASEQRDYSPDMPDDELDSVLSDMEIECAADHGFNPHIDESAAWAAQSIYRNVFLAATGRCLSAYYSTR